MARKTLEERFWEKVVKGEGCWEWQGATTSKGYGHFWTGEVLEYAHRMSWRLAYGAIPEKLLVCHHCDNPPCIRPDHLFVGTTKDNADDMVRKGRYSRVTTGRPFGEAQGSSKLTTANVLEIRDRYAAGETQKTLANEFQVCQPHISDIVNNKLWKHLGATEVQNPLKTINNLQT